MSEDVINASKERSIRQTHLQSQDTPLELIRRENHPTREFDFAFPSSSTNRTMVVEEPSKYTYPTKLMSAYDRENYTVSTDHCYARPWNWRPEASFLRPTKTLFVAKDAPGKRKSSNPLIPYQEMEEVVDVDVEPELPTPVYDVHKARNMMEECERHAFLAKNDNGEEDWEEKISKMNWTATQNRVFSHMVGILNSFTLGKLSHTGVHNEPLLRRTVIDKAVQRVRRLLATVAWDPKVTQWLHQLLIDNLDPYYLACYLDVLQTLKSKLPTFVDKMMYGPNSSLKLGSLNNSSLLPLLEKNWDPVAPSLYQDKPKKLPGNPIIVLVPSAPLMSKMLQKWIKLLSHLATVVTIPTNFGSTGHRMTMISCLDQIFSITRGKIQDIKADYPGRQIILVGFNAGATLALQLAQVESVLCVVSLGFSLLTAEGRRGEPDDNLMELQCPVMFVIGQCSSTSLQEDMEELRERMRVETGLIVVGSADDYLRVSKKKKKIEGITQSIVDRCIIDEVGEFISGIILSPYPPQIRQSPNHVPPESTVKKGKNERTRYNSNASSLDSEPPSPTPPRIPRPVGRPPGSKSKSRLEAKWAQQIAQGNTVNATPTVNSNSLSSPPSSPPPPYPNTPTPDTSSTDSSQPDKHQPPCKTAEPPAKKIRTLKPVVASNRGVTPSGSSVKSLPSQGNNLSTLLQGGIKTIPPSQPRASPASGIKVLENVTLNSSTTAKLIQNRTIDLAKVTLINSVKGNTTVGNVLLLPDGKLKTIPGTTTTIKTSGGNQPIVLPMSPQKNTPRSRSKYITGKRQLMGQKPPRSAKKPIYLPNPPIQTNLPPPTNLTTQDIMDLPIIFADDNQILDPNVSSGPSSTTVSSASSTSLPTTSVTLTSPALSKVLQTVTPGKFMLVNKQPAHGNYILTATGQKKHYPLIHSPLTFGRPPPKYTKIILSSKKTNVEDNKKLQALSQEITVKKVGPVQAPISKPQTTPPVELIDLENEIKATAVPKPNPLVIKRPSQEKLMEKPQQITFERPPVSEDVDESDPDYIPPKKLKFE